jgi:hypothetical protein
MLLLIAFVPILEIAKLASAFKILVFALINVALVGFRESDTASYDPAFESPLYPWTQVFGAVTGLALLTQMGAVAMVGAVVIVAGSALWYVFYVRPRVAREGAIRESMRQSVGRLALERTEAALGENASTGATLLVALSENDGPESESTLLHLAATLCPDDGRLVVVQFDEVPDQTPLRYASGVQSADDLEFERRTDELAASLDVPVEYGELVSHHPTRAVVNAAADLDADTLLLDQHAAFGRRILESGVDYIRDEAPCDTLAVETHDIDDLSAVTLVATRGPYDPLKVRVGDALAAATGADLRFVYPLDEHLSEEQLGVIREYHDELIDVCSVPTACTFVERSALASALAMPDPEGNLVIHSQDGGITARFSRREQDTRAAIDDSGHAAIEVHSRERPDGLVDRVLQRVAF